MGRGCLLLFALVALPLGEGRFYGSAPADAAGYKVDLGKLYEKTGLTKHEAGNSCAELLSMGMTDSGVYWLKPPGVKTAYQAYCDQKSWGGGWQMCYTNKYKPVVMADEKQLGYNASLPYKTDGYRSNCKYVPFNQVIYIYHAEPRCTDRKMKKCRTHDGTSDEDEKAYFTYETTQGEANIHYLIAGSSGANLVSPSVRLMYSELEVLRDRYHVAVDGQNDVDSVGRERFAGSIASANEVMGLWENEADKYNLAKRTTDFWRGRGVAYKVSADGAVSTTENWKYQLVMCDEHSKAPVGFFMSGIEGDRNGCFKTCDNWCDDQLTDHYRAAWGETFCNSTTDEPGWCVGTGTPVTRRGEGLGNDVGPGRTAGTAFKQNGYTDLTFKLVSVGIRYRVQIPRDRNSGEANPTDYEGAEVKTFPWNFPSPNPPY